MIDHPNVAWVKTAGDPIVNPTAMQRQHAQQEKPEQRQYRQAIMGRNPIHVQPILPVRGSPGIR